MEKPGYLKKGEFENLLKLLKHSFRLDMNASYGHIYTGDKKDFYKHLVIKDKREIVSHIGLFPLKAEINGAIVKIGGIGGVATYTQHRGTGLMGRLLKHVINIMEKESYDISWLLGDRKRYGNYGFENGGRIFSAIISGRYLKQAIVSSLTAKKYNGESVFLKEIRKIHEREPFKVKRTLSDYKRLFSRLSKDTYLAYQNKKAVSYMTIERGKENPASAKVYELGGEIEGIEFLLKYLFDSLKIEKFELCIPAACTNYKDLIFKCGDTWKIDCLGKIRIINLRTLLGKFERQMTERLKGVKGVKTKSITLKIKGTSQAATLRIHKEVSVVEKKSNIELMLDQKDMVRLLFGLSKPSDDFKLDKRYRVLDILFPLELFIWPIEEV